MKDEIQNLLEKQDLKVASHEVPFIFYGPNYVPELLITSDGMVISKDQVLIRWPTNSGYAVGRAELCTDSNDNTRLCMRDEYGEIVEEEIVEWCYLPHEGDLNAV